MPPVACRFWGTPQGCKFGDRCKFEHPRQTDNRGGHGNSNNNRFSALQNQDNSNVRNNRYQQGGGPTAAPYSLEKEHIVTDLTADRPQWILSAYGPGRQAPAQLFGGPTREQSFEEMRLLHYMAAASGNAQQAAREAENLFNASEHQIQTALNDVDGAIRFIVNAQNEHPNRVDNEQVAQGPWTPWVPPVGSQLNPLSPSKGFQSTPLNPLGATNQPAAPAFGAPNQPMSAFGRPSQLAGPISGAPSGGAFGQPTFGQSSQAGTASAFGQPSQLGGAGGFGKASQLGGGGSLWGKPNPFGTPSGGTSSVAAAPFSGFVSAPNAFSQAPAPAAGGFGAPSQPTTSAPFGAPSQPAPFGAPSQPAQGSPFGQPSGALNPLTNASAAPFGAPSPAKNPFATNPQSTNTNTFGTIPAPQNVFGNNSSASNAPNLFNTTQPNPPTSSPFGNPAVNTSNPNSIPPRPIQPVVNGTSGATVHPPLNGYSTKDQNGRLMTFKGKRVTYQNGVPGVQNMDQSWSKICFPEGPPPFYKDTEMDDSAYDESTKAVYMQMGQTGAFPGGVMPLLPPKREWCTWDF